ESYGYDCKNAAHAIRLLRMGTEFLRTGALSVWREDREELIEIKVGKWKLEDVKALAELEYAKLDLALAASPLPEQPDFARIERLVVDLLCMAKCAEVSTRGAGVMRQLRNEDGTPGTDWSKWTPWPGK